MATTDNHRQPRPVLEIVGPPQTEISIYPRSHDPQPAVFAGRIPPSGQLRLKVPPGYLVIVAPGHATVPAHFEAGVEYLKFELTPD